MNIKHRTHSKITKYLVKKQLIKQIKTLEKKFELYLKNDTLKIAEITEFYTLLIKKLKTDIRQCGELSRLEKNILEQVNTHPNGMFSLNIILLSTIENSTIQKEKLDKMLRKDTFLLIDGVGYVNLKLLIKTYHSRKWEP